MPNVERSAQIERDQNAKRKLFKALENGFNTPRKGFQRD